MWDRQIDAADYHGFALKVARRYGNYHILLRPDDVYQVAMIGLLEWWRKEPDAHPGTGFKAMRWAVLAELRKLLRASRNANTVPLDDIRVASAAVQTEDVVLAAESSESFGDLLRSLPDVEFQMIGLRIMGHHPIPIMVANGWKPAQAAKIYHQARRRLRLWMEESA